MSYQRSFGFSVSCCVKKYASEWSVLVLVGYEHFFDFWNSDESYMRNNQASFVYCATNQPHICGGRLQWVVLGPDFFVLDTIEVPAVMRLFSCKS